MSRPLTVPRVARTLHAWAGAALSLLVIVVSASGALLVWKDEYIKLVVPEARASFTPTPEAIARIAQGADQAFAPRTILMVDFADEHLGISQAYLVDDEMAYLDENGAVIARWRIGRRFEDWLFELHHRLLMKNTGLRIAGFGGLAVVVLVVAGVIAYWPMIRGFRLGPWLRGTGRGELLLTHRNLGIIVAPLIAMMALTGAGLAFPDATRSFLMRDAEGDPSYGESFDDGLDELSGAEVAGWGPALERAQAAFPNATIRSADWPGPFSGYRVIHLQRPGEWHPLGRSEVYIDGAEGWMDLRIDAQTLPLGERVFNGLYPVHTARLGILYKILISATGASLTTLGCLGLVAFLRRPWGGSRSGAGAKG